MIEMVQELTVGVDGFSGEELKHIMAFITTMRNNISNLKF